MIINAKRALKLCPNYETKRVDFEIITPSTAEDVDEPTMTGAVATCPFCGSQQPGEYIKHCGQEGKLKAQMRAVVYQEEYGKEYRQPTQEEVDAAEQSHDALDAVADDIPNGLPDEPLPGPETLGFRVPLYGFTKWSDLFTSRQLLALMTFLKWTRATREEMENHGYSPEWVESIQAYMAAINSKAVDYNSTLCVWHLSNEQIAHTFSRYALPITWDFAEAAILEKTSGGYPALYSYTMRVIVKLFDIRTWGCNGAIITQDAAQQPPCAGGMIDAIITDPPYYDSIPFADLSDFFYVWIRRSMSDRLGSQFVDSLTPKFDELVLHSGRFDGDKKAATEFYECGMAQSFRAARNSLTDEARIIIVFAHKDPAAWETLTAAMIDAGLVVTASWPIDTEQASRISAQGKAALATSLWIVCRKRPEDAREGRYGQVKREMQERLTERLRYFWDAGIQGPDFVWAAIGPALESFSRFDKVKRQTGEAFSVIEFLTEVRRMVTDFALGKILGGASTEALDEWTRYYLMHRNHFGEADAPVGECILLAQGYGVSLNDLTAPRIGILKKTSSGGALRLLGHADRSADRVGARHASGALPIIDILHRIMNLWEAGERAQINVYLSEHGLHENNLYRSVIQALIEMSSQGSSERSLLETIINYRPSPTASGVTLGSTVSEEDPQYLIEGVEP